ncbi:MAG TPA: J domain-containing protein [Pararhizobium sp.]|nr:J domain-containing protein [Pararhizobium sp.]
MASDPYSVLGVGRDASQEEIQKAFRKKAKTLHPDINPGNKEAEQKFKDISAAYEVIGDKDKRARYDRGEIGPDGSEQPQRQYYREYANAGADNPYQSAGGFADFGEGEDIFSQFFSRRGAAGGRTFRMRGQDAQYSMNVEFLDAVNGTATQIRLPNGPSLDVRIPPGTRDGQTLRLKGKGHPGAGGGEPGDALIEVHVRPHAFFTRDGDDIRLDLPITLREAVLGGKINVPTPKGPVTVAVPANASSGKVLRLKGRGVPKRGGGEGDLYVMLRVVLPEAPDAELESFVEKWQGPQQNPRAKMGV